MSGMNLVLREPRRRGAEARVAHEVLFPENYLEEFVDIFERKRPPRAPTVYLCAQEACHGLSGWAEDEPVFVMANAPAVQPGSEDPEALDLEARVVARLRETGLAGAERIVFRRSPADLARAYPGSSGSIYGLSSNSRWSAFQRAPNRVGRLPGLYLASGSVHPGGGLPLVARSGSLAAAALLSDLGHASA